MTITFEPIGRIRSPYTDLSGMPIQPAGAKGTAGRVELDPEYVEGLKDLSGFSHIILLYHFHKSRSFRLTVTPFLDNTPRGVFSTRAPSRPNSIGFSIVRLIGIENHILQIEDVDVLDQTPLLDIKPYVPAFDSRSTVRIGWLEGKTDKDIGRKSDHRFIDPPDDG